MQLQPCSKFKNVSKCEVIKVGRISTSLRAQSIKYEPLTETAWPVKNPCGYLIRVVRRVPKEDSLCPVEDVCSKYKTKKEKVASGQ